MKATWGARAESGFMLNGEAVCLECRSTGTLYADVRFGLYCKHCAAQPSSDEIGTIRRVWIEMKEAQNDERD